MIQSRERLGYNRHKFCSKQVYDRFGCKDMLMLSFILWALFVRMVLRRIGLRN